ncbi:MAG: hypothetical protein ACYC6T_08170 [Thermoleophilia bacterium]
MKLTDTELRAMLNWYMCSDPWPASEEDHEIMTALVDGESRARGYENWVVAFHELPEGAATPIPAPHIIEFRADGWTIQHPLSCRPNLFDCLVNRVAEQDIEGPPKELGRFPCHLDENGRLVLEVTA